MVASSDVVVAGVGMHPWGKWGRNFVEYGVAAARAALADAGVSWRDVQLVSGADTMRNGYPGYVSGATFAQALGWTGARVTSSYAACASGATALEVARAEILAGRCEVALVVGADTTPKGFLAPNAGDRPDDPDWLRFRLLGATNPAYFALYARRRMALYGATERDFALVREKNGKHGLENPNARYRKAFSVEEILDSAMVADPLRLLEICATSDGGAAIVLTSAYGWAVERIAYRPLRGSTRLAPLISAIGMSIVLENYVQLLQGPRPKPIEPVIRGGFALTGQHTGFVVQLGYLQIVIVVLTIVLMTGFAYLISKTPLGRAQRACEQDRKMASLLGVNVDLTISQTFIMGAALAAVAGMMVTLYWGVNDFFMGFVAGIKAFTAAVLGGIGSLPGAMLGGVLIGLIEAFWSAYFSAEYKDVAAFGILVLVLIFRPTGLLGRPEVEKV